MFAYQLEQVDRNAGLEFTGAIMAAAAGAEIDIPDPGQRRREYIAELNAEMEEPKPSDKVDAEIREALGL